jgi:hypothetical protein
VAPFCISATKFSPDRNPAEPRRKSRVLAAKETIHMQTGFIEMTMIAALMLSSLVWIQPF